MKKKGKDFFAIFLLLALYIFGLLYEMEQGLFFHLIGKGGNTYTVSVINSKGGSVKIISASDFIAPNDSDPKEYAPKIMMVITAYPGNRIVSVQQRGKKPPIIYGQMLRSVIYETEVCEDITIEVMFEQKLIRTSRSVHEEDTTKEVSIVKNIIQN